MANRTLPDTCAWIDFFRGRSTRMTEQVDAAIVRGEAVTCGVVIFELLQGIKNASEESLVLNALQALPNLDTSGQIWIKAGKLSSQLRANGQALPMSDIVIATLAMEHSCSVLTVDQHFTNIQGLSLVI